MLDCRVHADAEEYLADALEALEQNEVANNLVLGVPLRMRLHPERVHTQPYLATIHDGATFAGCAIITPPYHLVIHAEEGYAEAVVDTVANDLLDVGWKVSGVNGRVPISEMFARQWQAAAGHTFLLGTALRAFELREVTQPPASRGALRKASPDDLDVVAPLLYAFDAEAMPLEVGWRTDDLVRTSLGDGNIYLWEDQGQPLCLVGKSRPLPHGVTIAPVYTPPDQRGRGYASNAVAALSQLLLDAGWQFCCLFTDLSNSTSNSIYQKIGYLPLCDYADYVFADA